MPKITGGFSTKNKEEMLQKLAASGVDIKLPFIASPEWKCSKNPFKNSKFKSFDGKEQKVKLKAKPKSITK
jgi:hypothetical protein